MVSKIVPKNEGKRLKVAMELPIVKKTPFVQAIPSRWLVSVGHLCDLQGQFLEIDNVCSQSYWIATNVDLPSWHCNVTRRRMFVGTNNLLFTIQLINVCLVCFQVLMYITQVSVNPCSKM